MLVFCCKFILLQAKNYPNRKRFDKAVAMKFVPYTCNVAFAKFSLSMHVWQCPCFGFEVLACATPACCCSVNYRRQRRQQRFFKQTDNDWPSQPSSIWSLNWAGVSAPWSSSGRSSPLRSMAARQPTKPARDRTWRPKCGGRAVEGRPPTYSSSPTSKWTECRRLFPPPRVTSSPTSSSLRVTSDAVALSTRSTCRSCKRATVKNSFIFDVTCLRSSPYFLCLLFIIHSLSSVVKTMPLNACVCHF